jgi:RNA polymerase sigma-70 factor (ECF subfamily)
LSAVPQLVEHLFRHESGRITAALTRALGARHLALAEEATQEALIRALQSWPFRGLPADPAAWLFTAARNYARDQLRRHAAWLALAMALPILWRHEANIRRLLAGTEPRIGSRR